MNRYISLYERVSPIIAYHGTSDLFARDILKQGIIPNPKRKAWATDPDVSAHVVSRASFPGSYWGTSLMGAMSAAGQAKKKFGGETLIVIANIVPETAIVDEDDIVLKMNSITRTSDNLTTVLGYVDSIKRGEPDEQIRLWGEALHDRVVKGLGIPVNEDLLYQFFVSYLYRQAYYLAKENKDWLWGSAYSRVIGSNEDVPTPEEYLGLHSKEEAEEQFREWTDKVVKYYRRYVPAQARKEHPHATMRITEPVTYSGRNRIIAVVRIDFDGKVLEVLYGELPEQFIHNFETSWSKEYKVIR